MIPAPDPAIAEQFQLPGLEPVGANGGSLPPPPRRTSNPRRGSEELPTDRFFLALLPPPELADDIARLAAALRIQYALGGKVNAPERMHVTLAHLGDYLGTPAGLLDRAYEVGAAVDAAPFEIAFDRAASFRGRPGNSPFVLLDNSAAESGVRRLQQSINAAMVPAGFGKWVDKRFTPHLTMLYGNRLATTHPVEPLRWAAGEFVLVHSLLRKTRHIHLARWPLRS